MDIESRFISALLRANKGAQAKFYAAQIPKGVFVIQTAEIDWIYRFRTTYGSYPSVRAFCLKFGTKLPRIKDSMEAALEPVLDMAMFEQMRKLQGATKKQIDEGKPIREVMEAYRAKASTLTTYTTSHVDINTATSRGAQLRYSETVKAYTHATKGLIDSPWETLNKAILYTRPGERITVAGRSSLGKSWLIAYWAEHWARKGIRTGIFTKEMPGEQFEDRIDCIRHKLCYPEFRSGDLSPKELRRWHREKRDLQNEIPLFIFGSETIEGLNYNTVITKVEQYRLDAIWIDGVYLIRPPELRPDISDNQRFAYLSNRSKELAKHLNVVLGVTVQDNRTAEDEDGNSKGRAGSVYGSDTWLQDSDILISMGGKRGGSSRSLELTKGRESSLTELNIGFQLDPYPAFLDQGVNLRPHDEMKKSKVKPFKAL